MRKNISFVVGICVLSILLIALVLPSCATPKEKPGAVAPVPERQITIYASNDISGPYAATNSVSAVAWPDYADYLNQHGGIKGATVKVEVFDSAGKTDKAVADYERFREKIKTPLVLLCGPSDIGMSLQPRLAKDKVVAITTSVDQSNLYPYPGWVFASTPTYPDAFGAVIDWLVKTQPKPIKLAVVTWAGTFGEGYKTDEALAYAKEKGVEIVDTERYLPTDLDITTQVSKAYAKGANWIYNNTLITGPAALYNAINKLGLLGKVGTVGGQFTLDVSVIRITGLAPAEGQYGLMAIDAPGSQGPGMMQIRSMYDANKRGEQKVSYFAYMFFCQVMELEQQILERAIEDVGFDGLNGEAIRKQFWLTKDNPIYGAGYPYYFSETRYSPKHIRMGRFANGMPEVVSEYWEVPDLRSAKYR